VANEKKKPRQTIDEAADDVLQSIKQEAIAEMSLANFQDRSGLPVSDSTHKICQILSKITANNPVILGEITANNPVILGAITQAQRISLSKIGKLYKAMEGMFVSTTVPLPPPPVSWCIDQSRAVVVTTSVLRLFGRGTLLQAQMPITLMPSRRTSRKPKPKPAKSLMA